MPDRLLKPILTATLVAGTLVLVAAFIQPLIMPGAAGLVRILQFVASALIGKAAFTGGAGSVALGLAIHYALTAVMAAVYLLAVTRLPFLTTRPWLWGCLYGFLLWCVMYLVVMPLRWPALFPPTRIADIAGQLVFHVFFTGLPIGLIAARARRA